MCSKDKHKYNYYKCSNEEVGSTEQELIKSVKHKVYLFYINLEVISPCQSHLIIQFIAVGHSKQRPKLSVSFTGSPSSKPMLSIPTKKLVCCGVISVDDASVEDLVGSHLPL